MEELAKASANPEEIELGDSAGEEEAGPEPEPEPVKDIQLEEQIVPPTVFGSISEEMQGDVLGARQRFKLKKPSEN